MSDKDDVKEAKKVLTKHAIESVKKFKSTTVFVLLILFGSGFFLLKLLNQIDQGVFKNFLIVIIVLFVLILAVYLVQYVFKSEELILENKEQRTKALNNSKAGRP